MNTLDRLIIKAKKKCGTDLKLHLGWIYRTEKQPGKWIARGDLWNGIPYNKLGVKSQSVCYECDSVEEAERALQELGEKYPNEKDVTIILDNLDQ